jgi:hypothetical protein
MICEAFEKLSQLGYELDNGETRVQTWQRQETFLFLIVYVLANWIGKEALKTLSLLLTST